MSKAPRVGVKHWHDWQNDVALTRTKRVGSHCTKRVQVRRAMAVHHALRVARCATGVTHACCQVFVGDTKLDARCPLQQCLVVVHFITFNTVGNITFAVVHDHQVFHCGERWQQRRNEREQRSVDKDDFVFGVIDDVRQLLGKQTNVECVRNTPRARWRKIQLEVTSRVPSKRGNTTVFANSQLVEHTAKLARARSPLAVRGFLFACCRCSNDGLFAVILLGALKQMHQSQRRILH